MKKSASIRKLAVFIFPKMSSTSDRMFAILPPSRNALNWAGVSSCERAGHVGGRYKSGDFSYIPDDVDGPLRVARLPINSTTRNFLVVGVQCRGKDILPAELQPFCASFVHPDRPGWYYIARNGLLVPEPEYDPTDPETFDLEASLIFHPEYYFTGFFTFEYASQPGYKVRRPSDTYGKYSEYKKDRFKLK